MTETTHSTETADSLEARFAALYQPALASSRIMNYIRENPFCEKDELMRNTGVDYVSKDYPEMLYLATGLLTIRQRVHAGYTEMHDTARMSNKGIATMLFESAIKNNQYHPVKPIFISHLDNPLALCVTASSVDFEQLDPRDVAGHYKRSLPFQVDGLTVNVPFIAINSDGGWPRWHVFKHEMHHAENAAVIDSLKAGGKSERWASAHLPNRESAFHLQIELLKHSNSDFVAQPIYHKILNMLLSDSKDEALVRVKTAEGITAMLSKNGLYDDLKSSFPLLSENKIGVKIWSDYSAALTNQYQNVRKILDTYNFHGLGKRAEIIPWMLSRVPIENWASALNETGITAEAEVLGKLGSNKKSKGQILDIMSDSDHLHVHDLARLLQ